MSRDLAELLEGCVKVFFFLFFFFTLGKQPHQQNVSLIDAGLPQAVMDSSRLNDQNGNVAETTITAEKSLFPQAKSTDLRPQYGHFKQQCCEFSLQNSNYPEMTLMYGNQATLSYKNDQRIYYGDTYILGQVISLADSPVDFGSYELKPNKARILRP